MQATTDQMSASQGAHARPFRFKFGRQGNWF